MDNAPPRINPYVQQMVAGTNGRLYKHRINKLASYPIPDLPFKIEKRESLFLDVGCGWGRWMLSAARQGAVPVGIDIKLEAARATKQVLKDCGYKGYVVVSNLDSLPFNRKVFDVIWSYSVLQHVHKVKAALAIKEMFRVQECEGRVILEFPLKTGIWNRIIRLLRKGDLIEENDESWCVRYYSLKELKLLLSEKSEFLKFWSHCFFGIGFQPVDLKYASWYYHPIIWSSLLLAKLANRLPFLLPLSDSIYLETRGLSEDLEDNSSLSSLDSFFQAHHSDNWSNLSLIDLLCCPITKGPLILSEDRKRLISDKAGVSYPIEEDIPILIDEAASPL